jgi:hypothetical protein
VTEPELRNRWKFRIQHSVPYKFWVLQDDGSWLEIDDLAAYIWGEAKSKEKVDPFFAHKKAN